MAARPEASASLLRARMQILAAALLFSTGGAAIKACSLTPWQVAGGRSGIAALLFLALVVSARKRWSWRALLVATAYAATLILFVWANRKTTALHAIFIQDTAPIWVLLASPWLLREPIRARDVVTLLVMGVGLGLFFVGAEGPSQTAPDPPTGNLIALAAAATWAMTILGLRWLRGDAAPGAARRGDAELAMLWGNALVFLFCLGPALPVESIGLQDGLILGYLGVFQIALAYVFLTRGLRQVHAIEASLLMLLEPVLSPVWAWLFHREAVGVWAIAGGALVLAAMIWRACAPAPRRALP